MSFCYINPETKIKTMNFSLSNLKKSTSPANEFPLHKCRTKTKILIFPLQNRKNLQVQLVSFHYINGETKICNFSFFPSFQIWKNVQTSQRVSILLEKHILAKKCTSPSNEFLLRRIEWKNTQVRLMSFSYKGIAKQYRSHLMSFCYIG